MTKTTLEGSRDIITSKQDHPPRKLGLWMAIALVMGNVIGSGVFLLPQSLAPFGLNAIAGWCVTIAGALCIAHVIARLTAEAGGAVGPAELVERQFGPLAGFLIGFSFWVSVWTGVVTIAVGGVSYFASFFPLLKQYPAFGALGVVWMVTLLNLRGARAAGSFQLLTTLLKLVPLIVVAVLIVLQLESTPLEHMPDQSLELGQINSAAALTLWAMVGFESAFAASHKIEQPEKNVPRATVIGALLVGIIYLAICSGITIMLPADKVMASNAPFELFVATFWNPTAAAIIGVFAGISAIGAVNGWVLVQGELPLEMARRRMMPRWFDKVSSNGVPVRGLIVSSILASVLIFANSSRSLAGLFTFMALLTTSVTLWLYLACCAVALKRGVAVPVAVIGAAFGVWSLVGAGLEASGLSLVLMLAGLPLYWWARRSNLADQPESAITS